MWNLRLAEIAAERDYAAREAWGAEWDRDPDDDGPTEAVIPTTDGPDLVDLARPVMKYAGVAAPGM